MLFGPPRSIHFVGICGTAMASVAVALKERGFQVTGSDRQSYPPMSDLLNAHHITVREGYSRENLADQPDLVIIGNALSRGNPEVEAVLDQRLRYCSLPELIKDLFLRGKRSIVVAGTHGKTTTTALMAWVLEKQGLAPGFLIGGVPENFESGARFTDSDWFVIEGDEYDTAFFDKRSKFVHYLPEVALINNLEFDHADIFPDLSAIQASFRRLIHIVPQSGLLLVNGDDPNIAELLPVEHCPVRRFGLGVENEVRAGALQLSAAGSEFVVDGVPFRLPLLGELNVRNALAVVATARHVGLSDKQIQEGFTSFRGVRRRMQLRGSCGGVSVIDDFGHHPTAIRETLRALRIKHPGESLWAVFEPRSNTTRRNVFQRELAEALAEADHAVIAPVAREDLLAPEHRLDLTRLASELEGQSTRTHLAEGVQGIVEHVLTGVSGKDVIAVFSNGGFGGIHQKLLDRLREGAGVARPGM